MNPGMCMLAQLLKMYIYIPFSNIVKEHQADKGTKGFSAWNHFVCMIFGQIGGALSLRDIVGGFSNKKGKINHLRMTDAPTKSSISYANKHRSWEFFRDIFYATQTHIESVLKFEKKKFKFKNPLYSLDSSTISLCHSLFNWATYKCTKGAIKLHVVLNHITNLPQWALISNGNVHDVKITSQLLNFAKDSIICMDRGYVKFKLFEDLSLKGIFFVTRLKQSINYIVLEDLPIPAPVGRPKNEPEPQTGSRIIKDQLIWRPNSKNRELDRKAIHSKDKPLGVYRLVTAVVIVRDKEKEMSFITNNFKFSATTIAAIYKDRWAIESFFKVIKQNLKIKTFYGTSENAVKCQLWTALTAVLLIRYMQACSTISWAFSSLIIMFRWNMFDHLDLFEWLNQPHYKKPPPENQAKRPSLFDVLS
jgi:hypothetical protein